MSGTMAAMADLFCRDFRSLSPNFNLHLLLPTRRYYHSSIVRSYSSRVNGIKSRPPNNLKLLPKPTPAASSSQDIDIISSHEHTDGSLVFRFGDPSEVVKNVVVEEAKDEQEEIEKEDEDGVKKDSDGDHKMEVMVPKADTEFTGSGLTQAADHISSVVSNSERISADEGENDSSVGGSVDTELPIIISSEEMEVNATSDVEIDDTGNVEEDLNKGLEDSTTPVVNELDNNSSIVEDKETAEVLLANLESVVDEEDKDSSPDVASISDESVEMGNTNIVDKKETPDVLEANLESVVNEEDEDLGPAVASIPDESAEMENISTIVEEKEASDILQDNLESVISTDGSSDSEHLNKETDIQNEIIEDGEESVKNELLSPSPQLETTVNLSEEIEDQDLQGPMESLKNEQGNGNNMNDLVVDSGNGSEINEAETNLLPKEVDCSGDGSEIVEYESENDTVELMTSSTQLEAETEIEEETVTCDGDESRENGGAENLKVPHDMPQNLILESERTEVDVNVQRGNLVETSVHGVTELRSAESETGSQEILTTNFILSSGAALFPHLSKVLTGGEDGYFIAGQTWLGVADGVEQWSLEGTKPGIYAQELMKTCDRLVSDSNVNSINDPLELLSLSSAETQSPGSSTALIAQFDGQALHVANIGDSGFIVLRHGAVYQRSSPMFHEFHFPLQIERGDDPSSLADIYKVDLEEGDVIITATDGLLDNLYDQEILSIVMNSLAADKKPEEIAELLATKARERGSSPSGRSPFADDAQAAGYSGYTGGRLDDVAVIVSLVQNKSKPQTL